MVSNERAARAELPQPDNISSLPLICPFVIHLHHPMEDGTPNAFSSATFRERDKAVQRKHDEETRSFKVTLDKANHANAELRASLFDLKNRSNRLVQSLGFSDLMEAQVHVDAGNSANRQMKYRDCLKSVGNLEDELKQAKILIMKMENRERELEEEYTTLRKAKDERYDSRISPFKSDLNV